MRTSRIGAAVIAALALGCAALLAGCGRAAEPGAGPELLVYAAASLRDVLLEQAPELERASGAKLVFNYGASGDLARQIVAAGEADVFLSAGEKELDLVEREGLVEPGTRRAFASNRLAVIESADPRGRGAPHVSLEDLLRQAGSTKRLVIADPGFVPAGRYAQAALEAIGAWKILEPRLLRAPDVRAAVAMVESGAADFAIVYTTDVARSARARIAYRWPAGSAPPITYVAAAIAKRPEVARARRLVEALGGESARAAFARLGFLPPREDREPSDGSRDGR